jgi:putative transposase
MVEESLLHFDGARYRTPAWCLMPNHVHVVIDSLPAYSLGDIVRSWSRAVPLRLVKRTARFQPRS